MRHPADETLDPSFAKPKALKATNINKAGVGANSYLRVHPREIPEEYETRLSRSYYINYCAEVVNIYVATLFSKGYAIDRSDVLKALPPEIVVNIDGNGRGVHRFLKDAYREALVMGWVGILTDIPTAPEDGFSSAAAERESNLRPYSRILLPTTIWDWAIDPVDGDFEWVFYFDGEFNGEPRWILWTRKDWSWIDEDNNVTHTQAHDLPRIPLDLLICDSASLDDDEEPFGHSLLRDIADINLDIYQKSSELEDLLRKTAYPTRVWQTEPGDFDSALDNLKKHGGPPGGAGYDLIFNGEIKWISPDSATSKSLVDHIWGQIREIRRLGGVGGRSEDSVEAHSGIALEWENSVKFTLVKSRADNLRDLEVRLWRTYSSYLGYELPAESVRYPVAYAIQPRPEDFLELEQSLSNQMPESVIRAQMKDITLKRFSNLPNIEELLSDIDKWTRADIDKWTKS